MAEQKYELWVNVKVTERELAEKLDAMKEADRRTRSSFLRVLIQQEWERRTKNARAAEVKRVVRQKAQA